MPSKKRARDTFALLICGFSVVIFLMIALTHQSLSWLQDSKVRLDTIVQVDNRKVALIDAMHHANLEQIITLQHMLITKNADELHHLAEHNAEIGGHFREARTALHTMSSSDFEDTLFVELHHASDALIPVNNRVRAMLLNPEAGTREVAQRMFGDSILPGHHTLGNLFEKLSAHYETENARAVVASTQDYQAANWLITTMLKITVLLAIGIAVYITILITRNQKALETHGDTLEAQVRERTQDLKRISTEAVAARREAEHASSAKSTFLANMSHELRTPLNAVLGFSEVMHMEIMGPMPDRYREYPGHINDSAQHLLQMIQQLLDMSRIEAGHLELNEQSVCLRALIAETTTIVRAAFSRDEHTLSIDPDSMGIRLHADQRTLKQTMINIISNAAKYSDPDDPVVVKTILDEAGDAVITIRDHGMGIATDEIARLFNPYERSEAQMAREKQGTGLGLAIARSLIEAHGGTLTLDSTLGEGTLVTIILPAARVTAFRPAMPQVHAA